MIDSLLQLIVHDAEKMKNRQDIKMKVRRRLVQLQGHKRQDNIAHVTSHGFLSAAEHSQDILTEILRLLGRQEEAKPRTETT